MKDNFLYQFREAPRHEFAETLYKRISQEKGRTIMELIPVRRRMAFVLAAFLFATVITFAISPTARAAVNILMKEIGGLLFYEVDDMTQLSPKQGGEVVILEGEALSPAEASRQLGHQIQVPTWVPSGFIQSREGELLPFGDTMVFSMGWRQSSDPPGHVIQLTICPENNFAGPVYASGSTKEVDLNGAKAVLTRGRWSEEGTGDEWLFDGTVTLQWSQSDLFYRLFAPGGIVSEEELIRMAESIE